jgi:hypothetical protein
MCANLAARITMMAFYMRGTEASGIFFDWLEARLNSQTDPIPHEDVASQETFIAAFIKYFEEPNEEMTAKKAIVTIRQNLRLVKEYAEEFMEQRAKIKSWNDAALIDQFRKNLNRKFMETFVHKPMHLTLDETIKEAIACDAVLRTLSPHYATVAPAVPSTGQPRTFQKPFFPCATTTTTVTKKVAAMQERGVLPVKVRPQLRKNTCRNCLEEGHWERECKKPKKIATIDVEEAEEDLDHEDRSEIVTETITITEHPEDFHSAP